VSVHESEVKLKGCSNTFRQISVKDHGRNKPTFIITNDKALSMKDILEVYAKRWCMVVEKLQKPFQVPWLSGKTVEIVWTA